MSHSSIGFKGTVDQVAEAKRMALLGPRFRVPSTADWALSLPSLTRTVRVSTGSGEACGVRDTTNAAEDIAFAANGAGSDRYDLLVNRFLWTDPVTQPAFAVVQGVAGAGAPNIAGLIRTPGTQYDAVLAAVKVRPGVTGPFVGTDLFNLTPGGGVGGPFVVPQASFISAVDGELGNELLVTATGRRYRHDGTTWQLQPLDTDPWANLSLATGWWEPYTETGRYVSQPGYRRGGSDGRFRGYLRCTADVGAGGGISTVGAIPAALRPSVNTPLYANVELSVPVRLELTTAGTLISYRAVTANTFIDLDGLTWPIG